MKKLTLLGIICLLVCATAYADHTVLIGAPKNLGIDDHGNFYRKMPRRPAKPAARAELFWAQNLYPQDEVFSGKGVRVAIVDSGISSHSEFNGKNITGQDFTLSGAIADTKDHGTCIAGIIGARGEYLRGIAPDASLVIYKVDDGSELIAPQAIAAAINSILEHNAKNPSAKISVVNLSYGILSGAYAPLSEALARAYKEGVVVVAPSGNAPFPEVAYPASLSEVIAVSALAADGASAYANSSFGPEVDFIAPGEKVYTTSADGGYMLMSGTSIATAFVSAAAAIAVQGLRAKLGREPSAEEVKNSLKAACVKLTEIPAAKQGNGFIDVSRLIKQFR